MTELTLLRASCARPTSPPMYSQAPMMLTVMNVTATGMPMNSSTAEHPNLNQAPNCQLVMLCSRSVHGVGARRTLGAIPPHHPENPLDGEQHEYRRQGPERPPLRRHESLDVDGAGDITRPRRL